MSRSRYWKLTSDEVETFTYNEGKLLNWEIKAIREPNEDNIFIGIFLFRNGTPFDYESIKGITYYYNNIQSSEVSNITKFLKNKFGGKEMKKGERIFLSGSKVIYSGKEIGSLAKEFDSKFNTKSIISLEFENLTDDERQESGLPDSKLLPIASK
ncbi:MAG: hypothetical protein IH841_01470 [Thaumarchaeota archaeon]|nr:hypothetical protein [Nitrososphaerota archaeon]